MSHTPLNLTARDFDAYAPEKATSNAFSRPRLEVKQRALGWARSVVSRLGALGIAVDLYGSDEHPTLRNKKRVDAQWVFFSRDPAAREELERLLDRGRSIAEAIDDPSPLRRHAFLALRIDAESVGVCFAVHPEAKVDLDNLRARFDEAATGAADELVAALRALPEQFTVTLGEPAAGATPDDAVATGAITVDTLRALVERLAAGQVPLCVGWSVKRDVAIEHGAAVLGEGAGPTVDEQLEDAIIALAPVYRLVAWSRDNDRIALDRRIESVEEERARTHAEHAAETERWRAEQAEARRRSAEQGKARGAAGQPFLPAARAAFAKKPTLDALFAKPAPAAPPRATNAPAHATAKDLPAEAKDAPAREVVKEMVKEVASLAPSTMEKGAKVRVLSGPFADKVGVIGELDGRGGARVLLGLLSTRVDVAGLEPVVEGRERPPLHSSHRRPLAPAPRRAR